MKRKEMTEEEKVNILILRRMGHSYAQIAEKVGRPRSTVSSFINMYESCHVLSPKRGRKQVSSNLIQEVSSGLENDPFLTLRNHASELSLSHETVRKLRKLAKFSYFKVKDMPPLRESHIIARLEYCNYVLKNTEMPPIIFTDESTVCMNLHKRGIWRRRGSYPNGSFAETLKHPISVMVWGGIGPNGYRTELIRCPEKVTSETYAKMLCDHHVLFKVSQCVPEFIWQQDGAPPHSPCFNILYNLLNGRIIKWPPFSPDLSPIEQVWAIIKEKLRGKEFRNSDELFEAIRIEWMNIPDETIRNLHESAYYRCIVCRNHQGKCLNQYWSEVHKLHHPSQ